MNIAENKEVARRFFEDMLSTGNFGIADELVHPDVILYHPAFPDPQNGRDKLVGGLSAFRAGFSNLKLTVEAMIAEGNFVVVRWRSQGTHDGELFGIPATGKSMNIGGMSYLEIINGKIVQDWVSEDSLGWMKQLGVIDA